MKKSITIQLLCVAIVLGTALMSTGCATTGSGGFFQGFGGGCSAGGT